MNYLIVAHQTATSDQLLEKLRELARTDDAAFTLLIPATQVEHLLTWTEGEALATARNTAKSARQFLERQGIRVEDAREADESPLQAIADELTRDRSYDAIIISTLPPGVSRWLKLDVHARAKERFNLPIISVIAAKEETPVR